MLQAVSEGAQLLEAEIYGANMQLWSKPLLLYYFVLTFEGSRIRPLMLPHFKQVECF